jgi:hypothetical protein
MIPYKVRFILDDKSKESISFDANEKPIKGEVYTIQDTSGKVWDARVTDVVKFVVMEKTAQALIEYRCKVEKHEETSTTIGFGKRS